MEDRRHLHPGEVGGRKQLVDPRQRDLERLFHDDVLPGPDRGQGGLQVGAARGGDGHDVEAGLGQQFLDPGRAEGSAVPLGKLSGFRRVPPGHSHEAGAARFRDRPRVVVGNEADPDDAKTDGSREGIHEVYGILSSRPTRSGGLAPEPSASRLAAWISFQWEPVP